MAGGTATEYYTAGLADPCSDYPICWYNCAHTYPNDIYPPTAPGVCVYTDSLGDDETNSVGPPLLGTEEWSETDHFEWNINSDRCSESGETDYNLHTTTTMTLQTGGKGVAGRQNLVEIDIGATAYLSFPNPYPTRSTKTGPLKWFQEMKSLLMAKQQMPMARFLPCCQTTRRWILHREPRRNVTPIRSGQANITRICRCLFVSRIEIIQTMRM